MPLPGANEDASEKKDEVAEDSEDATGGRKPLSEKLLEERRAARSKDVGLPKEKAEDLMPFPLNPYFRSHPVLSEELKDEIYKRVMDEKRSVRDVSAALGVEMRRVGAVVRLKAIEKQWEQEVCSSLSFFSCCLRCTYDICAMMRQPNRLVLKTSTMVTKAKLQLSDSSIFHAPHHNSS